MKGYCFCSGPPLLGHWVAEATPAYTHGHPWPTSLRPPPQLGEAPEGTRMGEAAAPPAQVTHGCRANLMGRPEQGEMTIDSPPMAEPVFPPYRPGSISGHCSPTHKDPKYIPPSPMEISLAGGHGAGACGRPAWENTLLCLREQRGLSQETSGGIWERGRGTSSGKTHTGCSQTWCPA